MKNKQSCLIRPASLTDRPDSAFAEIQSVCGLTQTHSLAKLHQPNCQSAVLVMTRVTAERFPRSCGEAEILIIETAPSTVRHNLFCRRGQSAAFPAESCRRDAHKIRQQNRLRFNLLLLRTRVTPQQPLYVVRLPCSSRSEWRLLFVQSVFAVTKISGGELHC
jgi:hypothetical protein